MIISERDKNNMKHLLQLALEQIDSINNFTLDVGENFDINSFIPKLLENRWPSAVDPILIADPNSEADKVARANGIIHTVIGQPITENTKFLDFGCGEGHVVVAAKKAKLAVGYDPKGTWEHQLESNQLLTDSWNEVKANGPYDVILVYDVLDHVSSEDEAINCLVSMRDVLSNTGKIFIRLHPWCSRHGTHLYHQINKAYLHLCLDDKTLNELGYTNMPTLRLIHPLNTYARWIASAVLKVYSHNVIREIIESFFMEPTVASLIKKNWKTSDDPELASGSRFPQYQCEQQFVDYVLVK
jgi:SAM-dependent methyltransferase